MHIEDKPSKRIFGTDNTMGLFVALYLILLAFFIVLTSVSNHATTRASAAMESVNTTFIRDGKAELPDIDPNSQAKASNDPVLKAVQQRFVATLQIEGRFSEAGGGAFEAQFPESFLFEPGSFQLRRTMDPFIGQLVGALREGNQVYRQEVLFLFGTGVGPVDREPTRAQEFAIRRAGMLARHLRNAGLEDGVYSTGFVGIPEGQMLAVFRRAVPAEARSRLGLKPMRRARAQTDG